MRSFNRVIFLLISILLTVVAFTKYSRAAHPPQAELQTALDTFMTERMKQLKIPGAAVGIVQGDQIVYLQGYGKADETGRAVTPQTPFLIASLSKSFTALGILQMVEAGKIDLDASVQQYIPWFQVNGEDASTMTVRHLLHQTSGFSQDGGVQRIFDPDTPDGLQTSIRGLADDALNRVPGTAFEYSNTNYDVLGLVIETVSGQSYADYIEENIYAPLEMEHSFTSLAEARQNGMSNGYYPFFGFPVVYDRFMPYSRATLPSAGLMSSVEDFSHYLIAHLNGGQYQNTRILSSEGIEILHSSGVTIRQDVGYAMGWISFTFEEAARAGEPIPTALTHSGRWPGFMSDMVLIPEKETGIVILMNTGDPQRESAYFGMGYEIALIALGMEPAHFPLEEDVITQNGRLILALVLLLLVAENVLLGRRLREEEIAPRTRTLFVILPYLLELGLAGFVLFVYLPLNNTSLRLLYHFSPDIWLLYLVGLVLTLGWGTVRTGFWLFANRNEKP